jgi:hypothetical protein
MASAERSRVESFGQLADGLRQASDWYLWGPYLSERQWGTVREDYSADGEAWDHLPHDHARSRAYRWGEDGMAGFSDIEQRLCLSLALWNGRDPILKERMFGLTGAQSNHGEDVKEHWWFLDAVPSHAWNRWRYHYPRLEFPYGDLLAESARRDKFQPEYEVLDTGVFDQGTWIVEADHAKADPTDILMTVRVTNSSTVSDTLHVLPTVWFRNTWSWELDAPRPSLRGGRPGAIDISHPFLGELELLAAAGPDGEAPTALFCENETNVARLYGSAPTTPYPKDGINDHVVSGAETVNPAVEGTKAAWWYRVEVDPGETVELRLRLRPAGSKPRPADTALGADFAKVAKKRRKEADAFYAEMRPPGTGDDEADVMRQAFAGMLQSKQLYYYDVDRWLDGDPAMPPPPPERRHGRNARWRSFESFDIMSMPDPWEYPWFAAWDLGFHCVSLAHLDPAFAKYQLLLLCREWFQHPNGALPAYEWDFGDVNPPVQAWAALEVFAIDGARDLDFLSRVFDKLLVNFTWWVNREDADGSNVFEGGFLGLDNIGPIDRSHLPVGGRLEQSDATGWMAFYAIAMGIMASILGRSGQRPGLDLQLKFLEHFAAIRRAMDTLGVWDEEDGLYYDTLITASGEVVPVKVRSMVGIIPLLAAVVIDERALDLSRAVGKQFNRFFEEHLGGLDNARKQGVLKGKKGERRLLLGVVGVDHLRKVLTRLFDEDEFLSPYGLRALSAHHREHPYRLDIDGVQATIDYEPAESTTAMFGGNSNWRGPLWFPLNYLLIGALERYGRYFGDDLTIEYPTGSGTELTLTAIADDLRRRLVSIFLVGDDGRRPCFGGVERLQQDPEWKDNIVFNEYFHGDNGAGLGASHQTGWTGLVADLIRGRPGDGVYGISDLPRVLGWDER